MNGLSIYKSYVESTERMMDRRSNDCSNLVLVNTALAIVVASLPSFFTTIALSALGLGLCFSWWRRLKYYRMHVSNKYSLINDFEDYWFDEEARVYIQEYEKLTENEGEPKKVIWYSDIAYLTLLSFVIYFTATVVVACFGLGV